MWLDGHARSDEPHGLWPDRERCGERRNRQRCRGERGRHKGTPSDQPASCEFQYGDGKGVLIVNIEAGGTPAAFDALKAGSATGGRTVADVPNLGGAAFAVSKKGVPVGMTSLGTNGILYVIESNLLFTQDIALIRDLMRLH